MNILKQIECSGKLQYSPTETKYIKYCVQYERTGHQLGDHLEDAFDSMIKNGIDRAVKEKVNLNDLRMLVGEFVLFPGYEDERRAVMSNLAIGDSFDELQVVGRDFNTIINLKTRLWFTDRHCEEVQDVILPLLPTRIKIEHSGIIDTLIPSEFMSRERSDEVLRRNEEIDFNRFRNEK